jgi:hypothetical protein
VEEEEAEGGRHEGARGNVEEEEQEQEQKEAQGGGADPAPKPQPKFPNGLFGCIPVCLWLMPGVGYPSPCFSAEQQPRRKTPATLYTFRGATNPKENRRAVLFLESRSLWQNSGRRLSSCWVR